LHIEKVDPVANRLRPDSALAAEAVRWISELLRGQRSSAKSSADGNVALEELLELDAPLAGLSNSTKTLGTRAESATARGAA
jgi:hypothetical protein